MTIERASLPEPFRARFEEQFGVEELKQLEEAIMNPPTVAIRRHPEKAFQPMLREVPWCSLGGYTEGNNVFGADPYWHAGAYYVQEPASMIIAQYITQFGLSPKRVLDLCAAPGGKSTLLRSYIPKDALLIANEIDATRANILLENLTRFGLDDIIVTSAPPSQLAENGIKAEVILVDAPCSGEGMFRKDPKAIGEWSPSNVANCVARQRDILDDAWSMLEEGGILLYSTCTFNREENEEQLAYLKSKYGIDLLHLALDPSWGVVEYEEGVYHFMPHHTDSEGLTIFGVRKSALSSHDKTSFRVKRNRKSETIVPKVPHSLLSQFAIEDLYCHNGEWHHLSSTGQSILQQLSGIKILAGGVTLGKEKGKSFIPNVAWAYSSRLSAFCPFAHYDIDDEVALKFLKRESLQIRGSKGMTLLMYKGLPLGFVNQVNDRANNLFPKGMMIRNRQIEVRDIPHWINMI